jgi:hypothetical protein
MLSSKYRRIYYHHLKKCGGSTVNQWLDTLTHDDRILKSAVWAAKVDTKVQTSRDVMHGQRAEARARAMFHWADVVHSHGAIGRYAPSNTFRFTLLRDPVDRLVSQVLDWRRLTESDVSTRPQLMQECVADCKRMPIAGFLKKHSRWDGGRFLDNYLTRALVLGRLGNTIHQVADADRLGAVALLALQADYDLVGVTEMMDLSRNAVCAMVGLPPAGRIPKVNASPEAQVVDQEFSGVLDILKDLTRVDRVIYDRARTLFNERHRRIAEMHDVAAFEAHHASRLLGEARGTYCDGATRYSVAGPIIGSGFHGRDGGGLPGCAVWSGPDTRTILYMPAPPNISLVILIWIRGYAAPKQRDQLRVMVDGTSVAHRFGTANNYADLLMIEARSFRDFMRLEIDIDETLGSGMAGFASYDPRQRGFSFDSYGWRPIS